MVATVIDPEYVLGQLSSEEKIALLSGDDMWHTVAIPRLGVPRVRVSDPPLHQDDEVKAANL
jgi:beta-glucosidase